MSTFHSGSKTASLTMALAMAFACVVSSSGWAAATAEKAAEKSKDAIAERRQRLEAAQKRLDSAAREIADLSMSVSTDGGPMGGAASRTILGVNIGSRGGDERPEGVEVVSVSPGGPAADAGIKAGDVIVEIEGKALKNDEDGTPRTKLLGAMRQVEPDEKVVVKYQRDGKTATATVTPRRMENHFFVGPGMPFPPSGPTFNTVGPNIRFMRAMGVFGNAELVSLTPKLGQYFGADKGLLVVRAPDDQRLKLEEGDVILDIDGRIPNSPSHAMRILSSYQTGEKLKLNVLRMKKRSSFEVTIPEGQDVIRGELRGPEAGAAFHIRTEINPFELPVPAPD